MFDIYAVVHINKFELTAAPTPDPAGGFDVTYRTEMKMEPLHPQAKTMTPSPCAILPTIEPHSR